MVLIVLYCIVLYCVILFVLYWGVCIVARQGRSGVMCLCLVVWNECSLLEERLMESEKEPGAT